MEKLKQLIEQYDDWQSLEIYITRIDAHLEVDFSIALENAKALLETICREVCQVKGVTLTNTISIQSLIKKAFSALGHSGSHYVTQVAKSLANIGQELGNLRNEIGITAHGRTLEEIQERNNKINDLTKEFLIDSTVLVACFFIRTFEQQNLTVSSDLTPLDDEETSLDYSQCNDFNEFWDDIHGEFEMNENYSFPASEILYYVDYQAYDAEFRTYNGGTS